MAEEEKEDCGCTSKRWTLFLVILFGLLFGVMLGAIGAGLFGVVGKWCFAAAGAAIGGYIGYSVQPTSFNDMFFWRKKR